MSLPGLGAIPSISGGPATSGSGDAATRSGDVGGITSPIVIGGYKSSGEASLGTFPPWMLAVGGAVLIGGILFIVYRLSK